MGNFVSEAMNQSVLVLPPYDFNDDLQWKRKGQIMAHLDAPAFLAGLLRHSGEALHSAGAKMPADRLVWHATPEETPGRDALDQLAECAYLNEWAAAAYRAGAVPAFNGEEYNAQKSAHKTHGTALSAFKANTDALADAVAAFPADQLGDTITNPITGQACSWGDFAMFFYWNNVYHEGQVNYIQVLYGDLD